MNRILLFVVLSSVGLAMSACSTVTIREKGTTKLSTEPTYKDSKPYFLWGLIGEHHVDVKEICGKENASQIQAQHTFLDGFLGVITLGIYNPRTAKVWCGKEKA